jgi:hypothetical protein
MEHATFGVMVCILRIEALGQFLEPIVRPFQKYWIWLKSPFSAEASFWSIASKRASTLW